MVEQTLQKRNHNHVALLIVLTVLLVFVLLVMADLFLFKMYLTKQYLILPSQWLTAFLRAEYNNNFPQGKADFMMIGTAGAFYVFLACWFYLVVFKVFSKHSILDMQIQKGITKEGVFWELVKSLFTETAISLGVFVILVFVLTFLAEIIFR